MNTQVWLNSWPRRSREFSLTISDPVDCTAHAAWSPCEKAWLPVKLITYGRPANMVTWKSGSSEGVAPSTLMTM